MTMTRCEFCTSEFNVKFFQGVALEEDDNKAEALDLRMCLTRMPPKPSYMLSKSLDLTFSFSFVPPLLMSET